MGDNQYNKYLNDYQNAHYQVKANVSGSNGASQQFAYDVKGYPQSGPGFESNTHLSSLSNCVNRLQTQLNQYLTKIIDEGSEGSSNYNLGSGEVLNSHLMEHYSSGNTPNTASAFQSEPPVANNGYSYYSNYPPNYPSYPPQQHAPYSGPDYYNQQYSSFQEPKPKKQKNK